MKKLLLVFIFMIEGCAQVDLASKGQLFSKHQNVSSAETLVYFYQYDLPGANSCLLVEIDGENKQCIGYPGYAKVVAKPGKRKVTFTPNAPIKIANSKFEFDFKPQKAYYFVFKALNTPVEKERAAVSYYNVALNGFYGWVEVEENEALKSLVGLKAWN